MIPNNNQLTINGKSFINKFGGTGDADNSCYFHAALRLFLSHPVYRYILDKLHNDGQHFVNGDIYCNTNTTQLLNDNQKNIGWEYFFNTLRDLSYTGNHNSFINLRNAFCKFYNYAYDYQIGNQADAGETFETLITAKDGPVGTYVKSYTTSNSEIATIDDKASVQVRCTNCRMVRVVCKAVGETKLIAVSSTGAKTSSNIIITKK